MSSQDCRWRAWHLHLSSSVVAASDRVVHHVVGAAADTLRQGQTPTPWFFMRYWQYGPHVRFRVANLDPDRGEVLDRLLRARMTEVLAATPINLTPEEYRRSAAPLAAAGEGGHALDLGELWPPGVYQHLYQPEVDRYGGPGLLAESEALFQVASELALAFVRLGPPEAARSGLGLRATQAALDVLADDDRRRRFCLRAGAGWQAWGDRGWDRNNGRGKNPAPLPAVRLAGNVPAPVQRWADQLGSAMTLWRGATDEEQAERVLHAHIHMLHNRLGLSVVQEHNHYLALAATLATGTRVAAVAP